MQTMRPNNVNHPKEKNGLMNMLQTTHGTLHFLQKSHSDAHKPHLTMRGWTAKQAAVGAAEMTM